MFALSPSQKSLVFSIFLGAALVVTIILLFFFFRSTPNTEMAFDKALVESVSGSDPTVLQDFFIEQVNDNKKDDNATKAAIYWISHRYFDNGGNIYEIYDFVNTHPEVSFLKEAEAIYPIAFQHIAETRQPNYSTDTLYAILGYYEAMDKHGYADMAVWGTAANKYSEMVLRSVPTPEETPEEKATRENIRASLTKRATHFADKVRLFIIANTAKTGMLDELRETGIDDNDILVGLNQYASARENLKGAGVEYYGELTPSEIFEFNSQFAEKYVPRLYFFTNYLHATALVYGGDATPYTVAEPLKRVVEVGNKITGGVVDRVINAKTTHEKGLFEYGTVKQLAILDKGFRDWLIQNGWTESDF